MIGGDEHTLEFLLSFGGHIHWYHQGYFVKVQAGRVAASAERPHGLSYSLTLHDPSDKRLVGFDNAHGVPAPGSRHKKDAGCTRPLAPNGNGRGATLFVQRCRDASCRFLP